MKIKLTEKFSIKRKGDIIEVGDITATQLIKEGKATAVASKQSKSKDLKIEQPKEEPTTETTKNLVIE